MKDLPTTLEDCIPFLKKEMKINDLNQFINFQREDLSLLHHTFGRWIRNNWKLWEKGALVKYFNDLGVTHPDDMSSIVIEYVWCSLRKEPFDLNEKVIKIQNYWKQQDVNESDGCF